VSYKIDAVQKFVFILLSSFCTWNLSYYWFWSHSVFVCYTYYIHYYIH